MRWKFCAAVLSVVAFATLSACKRGPSEAGAPSFLAAAVAGSVKAQYAGGGSFRILPEGKPGWRFTLHSEGAGESAGQGFAFHAMRMPTLGEHPLGELDDRTHRAIYWHEEGDVRKIFVARSGTVRITESASSRVGGSFRLAASLRYVCTLEHSLSGRLMRCEPAQEEASVEITGSFDASPLGGDAPGLTPYDG